MGEAFVIDRATADDGRCILTLSGRLDAGQAALLKNTLRQIVDGGSLRLVVDLAGVPFIDSAGLSALVYGLKMARRGGGDLVLIGVQPQTLTVLSLTMLDKVFPIHTTREAALASFRA